MINTIDRSFEYLANEAKNEFQYNVGGLLELHQYLTDRVRKTKDRNNENVFIPADELEILSDQLLKIIGDLMSQYATIDKCMVQSGKREKSLEFALAVSSLPCKCRTGKTTA